MKYTRQESIVILQFHDTMTFLEISQPPKMINLIDRVNEGDLDVGENDWRILMSVCIALKSAIGIVIPKLIPIVDRITPRIQSC